ncbi:hypothetical protein [Schlesneria paludicola]|uniref:hypothetical protein n=1 Tax=Schlesneria paludicola TaxID=360056 RepID=UPI00029A6A61|nr:hypothetical protein [Schlesneria paludicola]
MKRIRFPGFTCVLPWAIVSGMIGSSTDAYGAGKTTSKTRKSDIAAVRVRAQNTDEAAPPHKRLTDEEIFDRELTPASTQEGGTSACVLPSSPGCTNTLGNTAVPLLPGMDSSTAPLPPATPSMPQQIETPPAYAQGNNAPNQGPAFQGLARNSTDVPFLGDFFGGSMTGSSVVNGIIGQAVLNPTDPSQYLMLTSLGGVPHEFQTTGDVATGTATNLNALGQEHLVLTAHSGQESVLINPPTIVVPPNPGQYQVYDVVRQSTIGGLDPALTTGRTKLAEGSSPIPRDRVFFNYSYFDNAQIAANGVNVSRYTPGFEKTFFNQRASVEVRIPFASTLTSNVDTTTGVANPTDLQFGNMTIYAKALLFQSRTFAYSTGMGMSLPTANNVNAYSGSIQTLHISNDAVHLLPFVGGVYTPNDRFYSQGLLQFDFDTNGNRVYSNTSLDGSTSSGALGRIGSFQDASFLYASLSAGYWAYRTQTPGPTGLTGFSPLAELHYNRSLQSGDVIRDNNGFAIYGQSFSNIEVLNAVIGANMIFGRNKILTVGYTTPLGMGVDRQFAGEVRAMFNWYFGGGNSSPLTRLGRAQF